MTKIAIVPNAAGTGTFSIEAPNSNSNRTLTLPDAAGELLTDARLASQAEAQAGTDNTRLMTPLRTTEAIGAQIGDANAGLAYGAVGTYVFAAQTVSTVANAGTTIAGSSLIAAGGEVVSNPSGGVTASWSAVTQSGALSGTWRAMGRMLNTTGRFGITLFLRIA